MRSAYAAEDSIVWWFCFSNCTDTEQFDCYHDTCHPTPLLTPAWLSSAQSALKTCHENGNFPIAKYLVLLSLGWALARHQTVLALALSPPHRSSVAPNVSQERGPKFINYEEQVSSFSDIEQWFHAMLHNKHSEARAAYGLMWLVKIFCVLKLIFCVMFTWQVIISCPRINIAHRIDAVACTELIRLKTWVPRTIIKCVLFLSLLIHAICARHK